MGKYEEIKIINKVSETTKVIELSGEVIEDITLKDLQKQAGDENDFQTLILEIASPGGSVIEGLMIMVWLDSLSQKGKKVVTIVTANAYSIASLIMLAAHYKVISVHGEVMVHNPMIPELKYANADQLEEHAAQLRELESTLYSLYELFTGLDVNIVKELMDNETYISPEQALTLGFVDEIIDVKKRSYEMTTINKKIINMSKTLNILNKVIAKVTNAEVVDQLYYDSEGGKIEIFQKDPSTYAMEDRTSKESGTVKIADGATLTIENFVITNIEKDIETVAKVEDVKAVEEPATEPIIEPEIEDVATEDAAKVEDSFNEGEAPKNEKAVDEIADKKEEAVDAEVENIVEDVEDIQAKEEMSATVAELKKEISELKAQIADLKKGDEKMENKFEEFENAALKAFDALANNQISNFKPKPKKIEAPEIKGSIFQSLKAKAGLK